MRYSLVCVMALLACLALAGCNKQQTGPAVAANPTPEPPAAFDTMEPAPADIKVTDNRGTMTPPPPVSTVRPLPPVAGAPAAAKAPAGAVKTSASGAKTYTVQAGDTFYAISRKVYGSDKRAKDIISCNPTIDPTKLRVGQTINLPD